MIKNALFFVWVIAFWSWSSFAWPYAYSWKHLASFGPLTEFNLFLTGDFSYRNSDVEGRVAVKGNVDLKSFSIGLKAPSSPYSLIVGGNATLGGPGNREGGQINNGGLWVGGEASLQRVGLPQGDIVAKGNLTLRDLTVENGNVITEGNVTIERVTVEGDLMARGDVESNNSSVHGNTTSSVPEIEPPLNFDEIDLQALANEIIQDGNDIGRDSSGKIYINLDNCTDLVCYLDISEFDFEEAWGVWIESSTPKTAIIRVIPDNETDPLNIAYKDFKLSGNISNLNVLYLFDFFQEIEMHHIGLQGSILAPQADISFYEGVMYGTLMGANLSHPENTNGGQINIPVPEPFSLLTLLFFGSLFYLYRKGCC